MNEKDMVSDILAGTKASLSSYVKAITECSDQNLRQTFQQMRDGDEKFQYDLYKVASSKGYYNPAPSCSQQDIQQIKTELDSASM